jgi:hypothetical protein
MVCSLGLPLILRWFDWELEGVMETVGREADDDLRVTTDCKRFKESIEDRGCPGGPWRGDFQ